MTQPSCDVQELAEQYNTDIITILDRHAPIITRTSVTRPKNFWFTREVAEARRECRRGERLSKTRPRNRPLSTSFSVP